MLVHLRDAATVCALIAAMALAGALGRRHWHGTAILALLSLAWLTLDSQWEGGILLKLDAAHGLTAADLVGLLGLGVAAVQAVVSARSKKSAQAAVEERPPRR